MICYYLFLSMCYYFAKFAAIFKMLRMCTVNIKTANSAANIKMPRISKHCKVKSCSELQMCYFISAFEIDFFYKYFNQFSPQFFRSESVCWTACPVSVSRILHYIIIIIVSLVGDTVSGLWSCSSDGVETLELSEHTVNPGEPKTGPYDFKLLKLLGKGGYGKVRLLSSEII